MDSSVYNVIYSLDCLVYKPYNYNLNSNIYLERKHQHSQIDQYQMKCPNREHKRNGKKLNGMNNLTV